MSRRRSRPQADGRITLTTAAKRLGLDRDALIDLVNAGEIPYHHVDGHSYIDEVTVEAIEQRLEDAAAEQQAEDRRGELRRHQAMMTTMVSLSADKQVRQRTGLDDHLELGEYKTQKRRRGTGGQR